MREIKFRAWNGKKMYDWEWNSKDICQQLSGKYDYEFTSIMQFTGLYDVNGKEIYEGDIIKHRYFSKKGIADVRWSNEQGYYLAIEPDGSRTMLNANSEIIGNIHENPELLALNQMD